MKPKLYFIAQFQYGKLTLITNTTDSPEEARQWYDQLSQGLTDLLICETIYG